MIKASSTLPPLLASSPALSVLRSSLIPALNLTSSSSIHHSFLRISQSHTFTTLSKSFAPYLHSLGSFVLVSPMMMTPTHSSSFKLQASYSAGAVNSSDSGKEILVQHLLVKEENLNLLLELQQRIVRGEDLSDLAVEYSICPSKEEGGMLGWVRKGQMVPEFEEAAFGASLNKVMRCKTEFGWHLLQVLSERVGASLEEIQPGELHLKMQDPTFLEEVQLIDVREPEEVEIASWSGFQVLPLRQFGVWGPDIATKFDSQKDTYVMCHHGMRSLQVAKWLQTQRTPREPESEEKPQKSLNEKQQNQDCIIGGVNYAITISIVLGFLPLFLNAAAQTPIVWLLKGAEINDPVMLNIPVGSFLGNLMFCFV